VPHKIGGRGTFVLDRQFRGVGRVRRASGTTNRRQYDALNAMLSELYQRGRLDVLSSLAAGKLTPMEVWALRQQHGLDGIPKPEATLGLDKLEEWARTFRCSDKHKENIDSAVKALIEESTEGERIGNLPAILRRYRVYAKPRMFNVVRAATQAALRDLFGKRHEFYLGVCDVPPLPYRAGRVQPADVGEIQALPEALRSMAWGMALTSMGPGEYWGHWVQEIDRVLVFGTKREHRERMVPKVLDLATPTMTKDTFRRAFKKETGKTPYSLRHLFSHLAEAAGVPQSRIDLYMGHDARTVRATYLWHEVEPFLLSDAKAIRAEVEKRMMKVGAA
jgi:integrase